MEILLATRSSSKFLMWKFCSIIIEMRRAGEGNIKTWMYSVIPGIGKKGVLSVYRRHVELLDGFGCLPLLEDVSKRAEHFLGLFYKTEESWCDTAHYALFGKVSAPELHPPTSDAAKLHILRAQYQVAVWHNAHVPVPHLPEPLECGWRVGNEELKPNFTSLPSVPLSCRTPLSCGCKSGCGTRMCKCKRLVDVCTHLCKCAGNFQNCIEDYYNEDNEDLLLVRTNSVFVCAMQ